VQDSVALEMGRWYFAALTYDSSTNTLTLYKDANVVDTGGTATPQALTQLNIGRYDATATYFKGNIDDVMLFNRVLSPDEITALYNQGGGTEDLSCPYRVSYYNANGWTIDTAQAIEVSVDFHYGDVSTQDGWVGVIVGDDANYVSLSVGSDGGQKRFYYETVVDNNVVSQEESRTADDGTLYVSYDAALDTFYLSHVGFGVGSAYMSAHGQWGQPVRVSVSGGSYGAALASGEAYLDNFVMNTGQLIDWPPVMDLDDNGYIELNDLALMAENWLQAGEGDFDDDGVVDFADYAEFGLGW
jgi:hypothetical protein